VAVPIAGWQTTAVRRLNHGSGQTRWALLMKLSAGGKISNFQPNLMEQWG